MKTQLTYDKTSTLFLFLQTLYQEMKLGIETKKSTQI